MDEQVKLLRQQVAAAEFLVHNLKAQLRAAEQQVVDANNPPQESSGGNVRELDRGGNEEQYLLNPETAQEDDQLQGETISSVLANLAGGESEDDTPIGDTTGTVTDFDLPSIDIGTTYPSLEDVKQATTAHAISQGWTCGVHKRDKTRILLRCRTGPDCPFHLRAEQYMEGAKICALKPDHNCNFQPDQGHIPRSHLSRMKFLRQQLPTIMTLDAGTTAKEISEAIFQRFGTRVSVKQCQNLKPGPKRKRTPSQGTCSRCGETGHNRITCGRDTEQQQSP